MRLPLFFIACIPSLIAYESSMKGTAIISDDNSSRSLISTAGCGDGETSFIHYFEVGIYIQPDTFQTCPIADQIKLGLDIDFILGSMVCQIASSKDELILLYLVLTLNILFFTEHWRDRG
jgi:hypothetical protein